MIFFTLKTIFISLLLIALIHYLYGFFKNTLTIPKVKDLVNKPQKQYETLFDTMKENNIKQQPISSETSESMKDELKNYLKELNNKPLSSNNIDTNINSTYNINQTNGIMTAESLGSSAYSTY